jgi:hypothetical protein
MIKFAYTMGKMINKYPVVIVDEAEDDLVCQNIPAS